MESSGKGAHSGHGAQAPMATHGEHVPAERAQPRGLAIVEGGLRFEAEPTIVEVSYPSPGIYRLFLQYSVRGEVRTAAFTTAAG